MRIERAQRQQVAHSADLHVDHEQELEQEDAETNGIFSDRAEIGLDDRGKTGRQYRDHEGAKEALDDPGAPVALDFLAVPGLAPGQHRTEMPGMIARLDEKAVEPQHVGNRQYEQRQGGRRDHMHREQIIAVPVPPPQRVEGADDQPGRPQCGQLGDRDL